MGLTRSTQTTCTAVADRILHSEPTPIGHRRSDLPSPLATAITRCLRKPPPDRFPSATEIADALNHADSGPMPGRLTPWWRTHQLAVIALYFTACVLTWQIKEWEPGIATALFIATCAAATVGGVLRGNLLWLERVTGTGLASEHQRARKVTLTFDVAISLVLVADGALVGSGRPVPSALTIALGVVIATATLVIEPVTTKRPSASRSGAEPHSRRFSHFRLEALHSCRTVQPSRSRHTHARIQAYSPQLRHAPYAGSRGGCRAA